MPLDHVSATTSRRPVLHGHCLHIAREFRKVTIKQVNTDLVRTIAAKRTTHDRELARLRRAGREQRKVVIERTTRAYFCTTRIRNGDIKLWREIGRAHV